MNFFARSYFIVRTIGPQDFMNISAWRIISSPHRVHENTTYNTVMVASSTAAMMR